MTTCHNVGELKAALANLDDDTLIGMELDMATIQSKWDGDEMPIVPLAVYETDSGLLVTTA